MAVLGMAVDRPKDCRSPSCGWWVTILEMLIDRPGDGGSLSWDDG